MPVSSCRHFNGYKPCVKNDRCDESCASKSIPKTRILLIHLGALGAVVRSTSLLKAIRRKYSDAHITWVTQSPADVLLRNHPDIDRVLSSKHEDILSLSALEFDVGFCIDKSQMAAGILRVAEPTNVFGFKVEAKTGAIVPATAAANELWELGLSNHKKFFINKKAETQLLTEALELEYRREEYALHLTENEIVLAQQRRAKWAEPKQIVVGLNTGCSDVIAAKKLSVSAHRELAIKLHSLGYKVVLLGGPEDQIRNQHIAHGTPVISSSTENGLRDGLVSVKACDIVVTGDSLGMHMAIALGKWTVAWFGPTCAHEIDLYDRGVSILSRATCSPCWKRSCHNTPMCYDLVDINSLVDGVKKGIQCLTLSSTPPSSEISCSPSHFYVRSKESGLSSL